jgi:hypothetical protein
MLNPSFYFKILIKKNIQDDYIQRDQMGVIRLYKKSTAKYSGKGTVWEA